MSCLSGRSPRSCRIRRRMGRGIGEAEYCVRVGICKERVNWGAFQPVSFEIAGEGRRVVDFARMGG